MHKVPLYGILLSDILGAKEYVFSNYSVKENGIELKKPHFDVGYVPNESIGKPIYRPTGVYIFGYKRQETVQAAKQWLRKHVDGIDAEVDRLRATKNKLTKEMEHIAGDPLYDQEPVAALEDSHYDYALFLTVRAAHYCALIVRNENGTQSHYTGEAKSDVYALWEGLHTALRNLTLVSGSKVLLYCDNPDIAEQLWMCMPTVKRIPHELMSIECFKGLSSYCLQSI